MEQVAALVVLAVRASALVIRRAVQWGLFRSYGRLHSATAARLTVR